MKVLHLKFRRATYDRRGGIAHVTVQMFSALADESILAPTVGLCGDIVMRAEEWEALERCMPMEDWPRIRISSARP